MSGLKILSARFGGEGAGDGDFDFAERAGGEREAGDDHGAVALADAAAAGHQGVVILDVGVGVEGDGCDVEELFGHGAAIEGLDIAEGMGKFIAGDADFVGGEAVEHECVVGIGAVGDGDHAWVAGRGLGNDSGAGIGAAHRGCFLSCCVAGGASVCGATGAEETGRVSAVAGERGGGKPSRRWRRRRSL